MTEICKNFPNFRVYLKKAVAISPSMAIFPWNLFCRDHSRVFIYANLLLSHQ